MDWFSLSLLCALSLASADAFTKKGLSGYSVWELLLIRFMVPGVLLAPLLLFFPLPAAPWQFWGWLVVLVPLELLAMLLYMQSIRDAPLCQTLPYLAFTPVFNILTGWLVLGEQVSLPGSGGIILVVIGAYLLNIDQARREEGLAWLEPLLAIFHRRESRRMLLVAIIYSFTSVIGKAAMLYVGPMSFGAFYFVLLGAASVVVVGVARPKGFAVLRNRVGWHLLVGGLMALMVVTHFLALNKVEAAYMLAVKRTSLLFGILYGAWLFGEEGLVKHLSAAVLMVLGVVLILMA